MEYKDIYGNLIIAAHLGVPRISIPEGATEVSYISVYVVAFVYETLATFFLVFLYFDVAIYKKHKAMQVGAVIGAYIVLAILSFGPTSGAAMNPARVLGPALLNKELLGNGAWVYYSAPFVGGALGAILYDLVFMLSPEEMEELEI